MVRINIIDVKLLSDEHLRAEWTEIQMLIKFMYKYPNGKIPPRYTLNSGHMSYFRNKYTYIQQRLSQIYNELKRRKFNVNHGLYKQYSALLTTMFITRTPGIVEFTEGSYEKIISRISERLRQPLRKTNPYHYYKKVANVEDLIYNMEQIYQKI